jgi:hypothetical protein
MAEARKRGSRRPAWGSALSVPPGYLTHPPDMLTQPFRSFAPKSRDEGFRHPVRHADSDPSFQYLYVLILFIAFYCPSPEIHFFFISGSEEATSHNRPWFLTRPPSLIRKFPPRFEEINGSSGRNFSGLTNDGSGAAFIVAPVHTKDTCSLGYTPAPTFGTYAMVPTVSVPTSGGTG